MTTREIINSLKQLAKTPTSMYALQSNRLILNFLDCPNVSSRDLDVAMMRLSKEDPSFALKYILEPFTYAFSVYLKEEHPVGRWPTTTEVAKVFKALNEDRLCPKFIKKRTRIYTIRKIISSIPEWHNSMSKGVRKQQDRVHDLASMQDPFILYVENQYVHKQMSQKEILRSFCKFVLSEMSLTPSDIENALTTQLLDKFEKTRLL